MKILYIYQYTGHSVSKIPGILNLTVILKLDSYFNGIITNITFENVHAFIIQLSSLLIYLTISEFKFVCYLEISLDWSVSKSYSGYIAKICMFLPISDQLNQYIGKYLLSFDGNFEFGGHNRILFKKKRMSLITQCQVSYCYWKVINYINVSTLAS